MESRFNRIVISRGATSPQQCNTGAPGISLPFSLQPACQKQISLCSPVLFPTHLAKDTILLAPHIHTPRQLGNLCQPGPKDSFCHANTSIIPAKCLGKQMEHPIFLHDILAAILSAAPSRSPFAAKKALGAGRVQCGSNDSSREHPSFQSEKVRRYALS